MYPLFAKPGSENRFRRCDWCRKDHHHQPDQPFLRHPDGKIRYDGININKICKADLRRSLGVVLLERLNLFTGTVMENIRYGRLDATDERMYRGSEAG